jgi:hypothetical protein
VALPTDLRAGERMLHLRKGSPGSAVQVAETQGVREDR